MPNTKKSSTKSNREEFRVDADKAVQFVKDIIKKGNARHIIIKNEKGETIIEFPITIGAVAAIVAPIVAAVGAVTALLTKCTIVVEWEDLPKETKKQKTTKKSPKAE